MLAPQGRRYKKASLRDLGLHTQRREDEVIPVVRRAQGRQAPGFRWAQRQEYAVTCGNSYKSKWLAGLKAFVVDRRPVIARSPPV